MSTFKWDADAHEKLLFAILECCDVSLSKDILEKLNEKVGTSGTAIPQHLNKLKKKRAAEGGTAAPKTNTSAKAKKRSASAQAEEEKDADAEERPAKKKRGGAKKKTAPKEEHVEGEEA